MVQSLRGAENEFEKALTEMNIQLHHVVNDLCGETGMRILRAILKGERDPEELVKLRDSQITRSTPEQMKQALKGTWRQELLFVLQQSLKAFDFYHQQMDECDRQLEEVPRPCLRPPRCPNQALAKPTIHWLRKTPNPKDTSRASATNRNGTSGRSWRAFAAST